MNAPTDGDIPDRDATVSVSVHVARQALTVLLLGIERLEGAGADAEMLRRIESTPDYVDAIEIAHSSPEEKMAVVRETARAICGVSVWLGNYVMDLGNSDDHAEAWRAALAEELADPPESAAPLPPSTEAKDAELSRCGELRKLLNDSQWRFYELESLARAIWAWLERENAAADEALSGIRNVAGVLAELADRAAAAIRV